MLEIHSSNALMPATQSAVDSYKPISSSKKTTENNELEEHISEETKKSINYQLISKLLIVDEKRSDNEKITTDDVGEEYANLSDKALLISTSQSDLSVNSRRFEQSSSLASSQENSHTLAVLAGDLRTTRLSFSKGEPIEEVQKSDPIILDLDGDGIETSGIKNGINFDINADGINDRTSIASDGDAFLAYDKNGNGVIDNGTELFGDQNGSSNGYEELSKYDDNQDGQIDKNDTIYEQLSTLTFNKDKQQIASLKSQGIESINTNYIERTNSETQNGKDDIVQSSSFRRNGSLHKTADVLLAYSQV